MNNNDQTANQIAKQQRDIDALKRVVDQLVRHNTKLTGKVRRLEHIVSTLSDQVHTLASTVRGGGGG